MTTVRSCGLATNTLHRSHTQATITAVVGDELAASRGVETHLKAASGQISQHPPLELLALKEVTIKSHLSVTLAVHGSGSHSVSCRPARSPSTSCCWQPDLRSVWRRGVWAPGPGRPSSLTLPRLFPSLDLILYSYEIFLVLSAIYFTYTVLKLQSDAQIIIIFFITFFWFCFVSMPGFIHVHAGKFLKPIANETSLLLISTYFSFLWLSFFVVPALSQP